MIIKNFNTFVNENYSSDRFELGTPVVYHSLDYNDEPREQSGEVALNREEYRNFYTDRNKVYPPKTIKGIKLYNSNNVFIVPEWDKVETFYEANARIAKEQKLFDELSQKTPIKNAKGYALVRYAYDDEGNNYTALLDMNKQKVISYSLTGFEESEKFNELTK